MKLLAILATAAPLFARPIELAESAGHALPFHMSPELYWFLWAIFCTPRPGGFPV